MPPLNVLPAFHASPRVMACEMSAPYTHLPRLGNTAKMKHTCKEIIIYILQNYSLYIKIFYNIETYFIF